MKKSPWRNSRVRSNVMLDDNAIATRKFYDSLLQIEVLAIKAQYSLTPSSEAFARIANAMIALQDLSADLAQHENEEQELLDAIDLLERNYR